MILEPGILLNNRYRIIEVLGQGGMGSIYRARDESLDIDVAVKDNLFTSDEYARQFRREATILAMLKHAGLPRVTDYFMIEGQGQYLVMDFIEGEDLRQRMERIGTLPENEVIVIGAAICDALVYLSSCDPAVVHRDIKPGNVKISPDGEIYLVDFGLAKTIQGSQITTTGARAMTPGFSPPEQYGTARTDMRTDIFSLGATLYAALTGMTPEDSLARAMNQEKLTSVRTLNPHVSRKVASVIEKALELLPENRYQTPEAFKQALLSCGTSARKSTREYYIPPAPVWIDTKESLSEPLAQNGIASKSPESQLERKERVSDPIKNPSELSRKRKGRKGGFVVVSILFLVLAGLAAVLFKQNPVLLDQLYVQASSYSFNLTPPFIATRQSPPGATLTPTVSVQPTSTSTSIVPTLPITKVAAIPIRITPTDLPPTPAQKPTASTTPIGGAHGQLAFASKLNGVPQIFQINSDGTGLSQITSIKEGACQPDFSPDGNRIVFVSPCDSNVDYYPLSSLYIMNIDGTGLLPLPTMVGGDYDPAWSPDGTRIAFTSLRNNNRSQIYTIDLEDNVVKVLSDEFMFDSQPAWSPDGSKILFVTKRLNRQDVWSMNADGTNQRLFSKTPTQLDILPSWSPDGKNVLITQYVSEASVPRVVIAPFSFDEYIEYQIGKEKRPMRDAVMSPDSYWIAFEGWEMGGKHNIFIITTTGINVEQVTDDPSQAFDPIWRPIQVH